MRAVASLVVSFGLVSIPVKLYSAVESAAALRFKLMSRGGAHLRQQYVRMTSEPLPATGEGFEPPAEDEREAVTPGPPSAPPAPAARSDRLAMQLDQPAFGLPPVAEPRASADALDRNDIVKGYEFEKGQYMLFTEGELKALQAGARDSIDIVAFVPTGAVEPLYYDKAYLLAPDRRGERTYALLLEILEHVALQGRPVGVTAVAEHFGTNKSKVFRHLRTLAQLGYVVQDEESERYCAGARLIVLAHIVGKNIDIIAIADPEMRKVRDALGHSVVLSLADRDGMRVAAVRPGTSPIEIIVKPGSLLSYHGSAQGKAALAYADAARVRKWAARGLPKLTEATVGDLATLEGDLARIRARGWAAAPNEAVVGLNALAVPVFNAAGDVTAALAIVDTLQAIPATPKAQQIEALASAAAAISASLGHRA